MPIGEDARSEAPLRKTGVWVSCLAAIGAAGCADEEIVFRGDWACKERPVRPLWTFEATVRGPRVRAVVAEPFYKDVVTIATLELERADGGWLYEGTLPVDLNLAVLFGGEEVVLSDESCDDVTGVRYEVIVEGGEREAFTVERRNRGKRQTN
jgi:hypothetical protein